MLRKQETFFRLLFFACNNFCPCCVLLMKGKNKKEVKPMTEAFLAKAMDLYGDAVYRLALCRLQNTSDAEAVYQEVFLRLFQKSGAQFWEPARIKAWLLLRVAMNQCADMGRRRSRRAQVGLEDIPELAGEDRYGYIELWDAVSRLPEKHRMAFHLHYAEGYKTREIAKILGTADSTVRVWLNRARNTLRKELRDYEIS